MEFEGIDIIELAQIIDTCSQCGKEMSDGEIRMNLRDFSGELRMILCEDCQEEIRKQLNDYVEHKKEPCPYCSGDNLLSERLKYGDKGDGYVGMDVYVENGALYIDAVPDTYEPIFMEKEIKINFCPMCGKNLEEKKNV